MSFIKGDFVMLTVVVFPFSETVITKIVLVCVTFTQNRLKK